MLFFVLNLIGIGIGPTLTGLISETYRGIFLEGGATTAQATADGLRYALSCIVFMFVWSTYHYYRAMRTLREEEPKI
jgi:hypothetical protein